jgi:acetoin utilization deacetylase AcuC-like enzyme
MFSTFKIQGSDCPGFEGLYNFCQLAAGSSIDAADLILSGMADVVVNWAGGFHHGKKTSASGFCYINDIVLCIL